MMNAPSLELELAVRNVARVLDGHVERLLEVLEEQSDRFLLKIVDEGSADETWDIARELARQYPQIRVEKRKPTGGLADDLPVLRLHAAGRVEANLWAWLSRLVEPTKAKRGRRGTLPQCPDRVPCLVSRTHPAEDSKPAAASATARAPTLRLRRRRSGQKNSGI
jgi:glycosyltransferase involved in cell wall biosynthesis